jgi:hypothetical protein
MSNWTNKEEELAKKEYLSMIDALKSSDEFEHEWSGNWDDSYKEVFGKKKTKVKGDKHKYMKYWLENQSIINDSNWNKLEEDEYI